MVKLKNLASIRALRKFQVAMRLLQHSRPFNLQIVRFCIYSPCGIGWRFSVSVYAYHVVTTSSEVCTFRTKVRSGMMQGHNLGVGDGLTVFMR